MKNLMKAAIIYSEIYEKVDFGPDHPFKRERFILTKRLFEEEFPEIPFLEPDVVDLSYLRKVHSNGYIEKVKRLSMRGYGYLSIDTPVFKGIYEWALTYCGGSLLGAKELLKGSYRVVFNPCGGLHHAKYDDDGGFCVFNDVALAAVYFYEKGKRTAIVDIDAHAGDGTMLILYEKPVLKISIHEDPTFLYPGNGFIDQFGAGPGYGYNINIPLPPGTSDEELLIVFKNIVIPALEKYEPEYIILQSGVDGYRKDPLTHLSYTAHGYHQIAELLRKTELPILMLGGGGYYVSAVPILWATIFATLIDNFERIRSKVFSLDPEPSKSDKEIKSSVKEIVKILLEEHPFFRE